MIKKKILFITPTFGRSGSEMLLLYMIKNMNFAKFEASIFSQHNGELIGELPMDIKSFVAYKRSKKFLRKAFRKMLQIFKINPLHYQLQKIQNEIQADFWYANTIVNPGIYAFAKKMNIPVITHFHELPAAYNHNTASEMQGILENSRLFVGCSQSVCDKIKDMGATDVKLLYGFIDTKRINLTCDKSVARKQINLTDNDFVWAISGYTLLTKGIEFVIPLLKTLKSNAKIIWIGTEVDRGINFYVKETIKHHFKGKMIFLGEQKENYYDYLNCADAFLLLSREDAFPLVMLEAAYFGKPIVSFNSGGAKEFVDADMGYLIDSWRVEDLADAMLKVEEQFAQFDSIKIKSKVKPFTVEYRGEEFENILAEV